MVFEMNCARQEASYSSSFEVAKSLANRDSPPNAAITSWPVKASSTTPPTSPVAFHWRTKLGCARFAIVTVTNAERGTTTRAMRASCQESQIIIPRTPTTVRTAVTTWESVCWSVWVMLSMSFVTRERTSPRAWPER